MSTKTLEKTIQTLSREVTNLRSLVIGAISNRDDEGEYRSSFVKKVLKATKHKVAFEYSGKGSIIRHTKMV
jgi:hypothetical protein